MQRSPVGPIQLPCIMVCEVPLPVLKRPGREADHSPPSGVEVKNEWSCNSTPPISCHSMNRSKFILNLCNFQSFHSGSVSFEPQPHSPQDISTASALLRSPTAPNVSPHISSVPQPHSPQLISIHQLCSAAPRPPTYLHTSALLRNPTAANVSSHISSAPQPHSPQRISTHQLCSAAPQPPTYLHTSALLRSPTAPNVSPHISCVPQPHSPQRTSTEYNIFTVSSLFRVIILPDN